MWSRCCLCVCMCVSVRVCVSVFSPYRFARQRLGKTPFMFARQRLYKNPPTVATQLLDNNPLIVARQLCRNVTAITNTHATMEELLEASFTTWLNFLYSVYFRVTFLLQFLT
jgi:hypothetical protein